MMLREIRKARGLSGAEVARRIGVPQSTYSSWEHGVSFSLSSACDICDVLGCTLDQLAGRERRSDGTFHQIEDVYASLNIPARKKFAEYGSDLAANPANTQTVLKIRKKEES